MQRHDDAFPHFDTVYAQRFDRRDALRRMSALSALFVWPAARASAGKGGETAGTMPRAARGAAPSSSTLRFEELAHGADDRIHVANGYVANVLLAWGDPMFPDSPAFDPAKPTRAAQERQFGTESDFLAWFPLPRGSDSSTRGLLCVNHEGSDAELMFPGITRKEAQEQITKEQIEIEMAAHGHSIVELERVDAESKPASWRVVRDSRYTRRMTGVHPPMRISGPAAGHARMRTSADPEGRTALGALNCCSGGTTPWGTLLIGEENIDHHFHGDPSKTSEARNHARMLVGLHEEFVWSRVLDRFDVQKEPNEANRFGWVIEVDPYDPASVPVRRTALGRFKHEGATCVVDPDGRVVLYLGDDDEFEFVYKFVTAAAYDAKHPEKNKDLLDAGTLYAARFTSDGKVHWLRLVHGEGPLTAENGFHSQADVVIEARTAATLLGATPMDRPEDIETNPRTGCVYVMLTKNKTRLDDRVDAVNPRPLNLHGHVLELVPPPHEGGKPGERVHASDVFAWEMFLRGGTPFETPNVPASQRGSYNAQISQDGWFSCPDNCAFDPEGRLWIATDGMSRNGLCNGLYAMDTFGPGRALSRHFFRGPLGGEVAGPCFTPDGRTLFLSIQHPGQSDTFGKKVGVFASPTTRFPDYKETMPARSGVIVIVKADGGKIGT